MFGLDIKTNMREREWRNGQREILALGFPIQLPPKYLSIDAECIYANSVHSFLLQYCYFMPISTDSVNQVALRWIYVHFDLYHNHDSYIDKGIVIVLDIYCLLLKLLQISKSCSLKDKYSWLFYCCICHKTTWRIKKSLVVPQNNILCKSYKVHNLYWLYHCTIRNITIHVDVISLYSL